MPQAHLLHRDERDGSPSFVQARGLRPLDFPYSQKIINPKINCLQSISQFFNLGSPSNLKTRKTIARE
jgi:hypothetical protein